MNGDSKFLLRAAAFSGSLGVLVGAFGAHMLPEFLLTQIDDADVVARRLDQFETGARYHLVHAVAILALASISTTRARLLRWVGWLFLVGIFLFSGSLYVLVLTNTPWLGAITPIGGVSWIIAWGLLFFLAMETKATESNSQ